MNEIIPFISSIYFITLLLIYVLLIQKERPKSSRGSVSIIIPFHNEGQHLEELINALLAQDYPLDNIEFIFVDDRSSDQSADIIKNAAKHFTHLKLIQITELPENRFGKKNALEHAITQATHDRLLFTDADCAPSKNWVSSTLSVFTDNVDVVIGSAPLRGGKSFAAQLSCAESTFNHIVLAASANAGYPMMAFGRNFAYRKSAYESVGGFSSIHHSLSGDDDLLLQAFLQKGLTVVFNPSGFSSSAPIRTWAELNQQKTRHFSTIKYTPILTQVIGLFIHLGHTIFIASLFYFKFYDLLLYKLFLKLFLFL